MKEHELKTWTEYYYEVFVGRKTFEVRKNDRKFKVGDVLILKEWDNEKQCYTGSKINKKIIYILKGGQFGIAKGFVVMGLE